MKNETEYESTRRHTAPCVASARHDARTNDRKVSQRRADLVDDAQEGRQDAVRATTRESRIVSSDVL